MSTNHRLARERAEKAFAQFVIDRREGALMTPTELPVLIRKGQVDAEGNFKLTPKEGDEQGELPLPMIAIACPTSKMHDMGYSIVELHVLVLGSIDEKDGRALFSERFGLIANLFPDIDVDPTRHAAVLTAVNKPASGPDSRVVKDFHLIEFYPTDDSGEETGTTWIDHLVFDLHCNPTDDVT